VDIFSGSDYGVLCGNIAVDTCETTLQVTFCTGQKQLVLAVRVGHLVGIVNNEHYHTATTQSLCMSPNQ